MANLNNGRREIRQREAMERKAAREQRSDADQVKVLDRRLGVGQGAKKERARLQKAIELAYKLDEERSKKKKK